MTPDKTLVEEPMTKDIDVAGLLETLRFCANNNLNEWAISKERLTQAADTIEALTNRLTAMEREVEAWGWLAQNSNLELTCGPVDGDLSTHEWQVHSVNGGYNDREWTLLATGNTPLAAVEAARAALSPKDGQAPDLGADPALALRAEPQERLVASRIDQGEGSI